MSVEIKVYLTAEQSEENLCFHAVVNNKDDYDPFIDLNETYESLMIDALNGEFELEYFDNEDFDKHSFLIEEDDYITNLNKFAEFLNDFYGLTAVIDETHLYTHFGVRLVGAGFRSDSNSPMLEHAQFNARNSIHGIKTQLFTATNNSDYVGDDIYIKQMHGSLKLTLEATKKYDEPIAFIRVIYDDIENETINPFKFENKEQQYRYQTIIKNLNDLNSQKKLKELWIIIDGEEFKINKRSYLKEQSKNIYYEDIELNGVFEGYRKRSNTFELYVEGKGKYSCHLDELENNDYTQFEIVYDKLKDLNSINSTKLKMYGKKIKPKTVNIVDIELL